MQACWCVASLAGLFESRKAWKANMHSIVWQRGNCGCGESRGVKLVRMSISCDGRPWQSKPLPMCPECRKENRGYWVAVKETAREKVA